MYPNAPFWAGTVHHFMKNHPDSSQSSYLRRFADDIKISNTNISALEQDGKNLAHLASENEMMFNTDKTVLFSVPYCEADTSFNEIRFSSSKICRDPGLYLTPELSLDEHLKKPSGQPVDSAQMSEWILVSVGSQVKMVLSKSYFVSRYSIIHWYGIPVIKCLTN